MRLFRAVGLFAAVIGILLVSGCSSGATEKIRYKMIIEVETPQGLRSGYAVREVTFSEGYQGPSIGEDRGSITVKGEAVAVDLPKGQTLFALLTASGGDVDYGARIFDRAFDWYPAYAKEEPTASSSLSSIELWPTAPKTDRMVNTNPVPMLVRFADIKDPKTVEAVKPDALGTIFGPGVKLKAITIQATNEPVTTGIEKRLAWVANEFYFDKMLDGQHLNDGSSLANNLTSMSFKQGK